MIDHRPVVESDGITIVIRSEQDLSDLMVVGHRLALAREEKLSVLILSDEGEQPDWFHIPAQFEASDFILNHLNDGAPAQQISEWLKTHQPDLMAFAFDPIISRGTHTLDKQLDTVLGKIKCPVALTHIRDAGAPGEKEAARTLVPFSADENSRFALRTALEISPKADLTVVGTGPAPIDEADRIALKAVFIQSLGEYANHPQVKPKLLLGDNAIKRLIKGSSGYDFVLLGASRGNMFVRALLGDRVGIGIGEAGHRIINETELPYIIVREYQGWLGSRLAHLMSRSGDLLPTVTQAERINIYKEVRRAARPQIDFFVMTALSAAIASFGLILNSAAVIIGAMLIAPLMSAIIGMGLAMVQGDTRFLFTSAGATARGGLAAVGVGILVGFLNTDGELTSEMLGRSGPNLFDLGVATLSGAAAAYALCRKNVSASLPGVAISVALVPPLASLGLFLSHAQWTYAYGALLLFVTNLTAIAFSCGIIFTMVGFSPAQLNDQSLSRVLTFRRNFFVLGLIILAVISNLTFLTVEKKLEQSFAQEIQATITEYLQNDIERDIFLLDMQLDEDDPEVDDVLVTVSSSTNIRETEATVLANRLAALSEKPVRVSIIFAPLVRSRSAPAAN